MNKRTVLTIAKSLGLFRLSRLSTRNEIRILAYHGVWFLDGHFGNRLFMSPDKIRQRIAWLKDSPYSIIPLEQAVDALQSGHRVPCATVITIDDGWFSTYQHMLPCLEDANLPATLYVYTGKVDTQDPLLNIMIPALLRLTRKTELHLSNPRDGSEKKYQLSDISSREIAAKELVEVALNLSKREAHDFCDEIATGLGFDFDRLLESRQFSFMNYEEIADAERRGLDIQLHTHTHHLSVDDPGHLTDEIRLNRDKLSPHVASRLEHFCYPSGVNCPEMYQVLQKEGIKSATLVDTGFVRRGDEPFALMRILDGQQTDMIEFEAELSGFLELTRRLKRFIRRH